MLIHLVQAPLEQAVQPGPRRKCFFCHCYALCMRKNSNTTCKHPNVPMLSDVGGFSRDTQMTPDGPRKKVVHFNKALLLLQIRASPRSSYHR